MDRRTVRSRLMNTVVLFLALMLITVMGSMSAFAASPHTIGLKSSGGGTISAKVDGYDMSITGEENGYQLGYAADGAEAEINAVPDAGYKLKKITYKVNSGAPVSYESGKVTIKGDTFFDAEFEQKGGTLSWTGTEGGDVTVTVDGDAAASGAFVKEGSLVEVTANADAAHSYILDSLTVSPPPAQMKKTDNSVSFSMPDEAVNVSAVFEVDGYYIEFGSTSGGTLRYELIRGREIEGHESYFSKDSRIKLIAEPDPGWQLRWLKMTKDGKEEILETTEPALSGKKIKFFAEFIDSQEYRISIAQNGFGGETWIKSVDGGAPASKVLAGKTVVVEVIAYSGNKVVSVDFGAASARKTGENEYTFIMPESDVHISSRISPLLAPKVNVFSGNGTLTPDKESYEVGEMVTVRVSPNKGYALVPNSVTVLYIRNGKYDGLKPAMGNDGTFSFRMPASVPEIRANFAVPHNVTVKSSAGGSVVCDLNNPYGSYTTKGRTVQLTVRPNNSFRLETLTVTAAGGKNIELDEDFSFAMPDSDVTVNARFVSTKDGDAQTVQAGSAPAGSSAKAAGAASLTASGKSAGLAAKAPAAAGADDVTAGAAPDKTNADKSITLLGSSDTEVAVFWDYDGGEYSWPEDEFRYLYFEERETEEEPLRASAVSSNEKVVNIDFCTKEYVEYTPVGEGEAVITYMGTNGGTIDVPVRVSISHGVTMLAFEHERIASEEVPSGEAVFDKDTESILVEIVGGAFAGDVTYDSKILDVDAEGGDLKSNRFYITPKDSLTGPAETVISGVDKDGGRHELTVRITQDYIDARAKEFREAKYWLYMLYFLEYTDLLDEDPAYLMWIPFRDYNKDLAETGVFGEDWQMTEDEVRALTGTITIGDEVIEMKNLRVNPYDEDNYIADFDLGKTWPWGTHFTLKLELNGVELSDEFAVKRPLELKYSVKDLTYNGKARTPSVSVMYGKTALKKGTDFVVEPTEFGQEIKKVGTYEIWIYAPGNSKYIFWETKTFKVNPAGTALRKLKAGNRAVTVVWKKQAAQTTGYQIQYSLNKNFKNAKKVTVKSSKTTKKTLKKLKKNRKYYVRIRTYKKTSKGTYYSKWSKKKSVKTR